LTGVASNLGARQSQIVSKKMDQEQARFHFLVVGFTVHGYLNIQDGSLA
jgi:hypothetical protein